MTTLSSALDDITKNNAVTIRLDFLRTLISVLKSAQSNPNDPRRRRFRTDSPLFKLKIAAVFGWKAVLTALQFGTEADAMEEDALDANENENDLVIIDNNLLIMNDSVTSTQLTTFIETLEKYRDQSTASPSSLASSSSSSSSSSTSSSSNIKPAPVSDNDAKQSPPPPLFSPSSSYSIRDRKAEISESKNSSEQSFDEKLATLIAMGFTAEESKEALTIGGTKLEKAISTLTKSSMEKASLALVAQLEREENEAVQKRKRESQQTDTMDDEIARKLAAQFEEEEQESKRLLTEQSEEYARRLQEKMNEEANDREIARKLADEQMAKRLLEEAVLHGQRLPLSQNNVRLLGDDFKEEKTFECKVCFEEYDIEKCQVLEDCHHIFCIECMKRYITAEMDEGKLRFKCPDAQCDHQLLMSELYYCTTKPQMDRLNDLLTNNALNSDPHVRWCPKKGCGTPMIGDDGSRMMVCPNPKCRWKFCYLCKTEDWHEGATCEAYQRWKIENSQVDTRFDEWVKTHAKQCPKCHSWIEKNEGCDHMTCRKAGCGYEFYWSTLRPYPK